jgi:hypothetical protein
MDTAPTGRDNDFLFFDDDDDVEANSIPSLSLFKRLADGYPIQVPVNGGFITCHPTNLPESAILQDVDF